MEWQKIVYPAVTFLLISILSISCSKEEVEWNTIKWKMNGRYIGADCEGGHTECTFLGCGTVPCDPADCKFYRDSKTLSIRGGNENDHLEFYKYENIKIGISIKMDRYDHMIYHDLSLSDACREYRVDTLFDYDFKIIQLDTMNRIIAGLFSFTAINHCSDTVEVNEGYFKLSYH